MPDKATQKISRPAAPARAVQAGIEAEKAEPNAVMAVQEVGGNAAAQEQLGHGPMARVFNRIVGQAEDASPEGLAFDREMVKSYLDTKLGLAEGEWFRGKKLDGVTDALMAQLDADKDGLVDWAAFQAFQSQTLKTIAPGAQEGASPDEVVAKANARFDELDKGRRPDGKVDYGELQKGTQAVLPEDTEHKDLIAQLAARIALDAADVDQRDQKVKDRTLTREEWTQAARQLATPPQKKQPTT